MFLRNIGNFLHEFAAAILGKQQSSTIKESLNEDINVFLRELRG
jgi:hypothetical protein